MMSNCSKASRLAVSLVSVLLLAACAVRPVDEAPKARNVILFIGDGMGVSTVTAARIFAGQSLGLPGEEHELVFETFPNVALVKTYNTNQQVSDSAGTVTAMMSGEKTRAGVINTPADVRRQDCAAAVLSPLEPISVMAKRRGLAVGVVTTARLTHATPAGVYASSPERDWETDSDMPASARAAGCRDMARQLVDFEVGGGLEIALGGGRQEFFGSAAGGERADADADLVREWLDASPGRVFVDAGEALATIGPDQQVLGLFSDSHMTYVAERGEDSSEPTLAAMTAAAIDRLAEDDDGYFLMVEGGRIDHGHHDGKPGYALLETVAFAEAIEAALERVDPEETLILVTADHSHVFTIAGYPTRGNPILGLVVENDDHGEPLGEPALAADGVPYTTLGYANGPGAVSGYPRAHPETGIDALSQSLYSPYYVYDDGSVDTDETHGGEDVALYATGPGAAEVRGVLEQDRIYEIMRRALGW